MAKTVAIVQSNYIPWKGYFDLINLSDEFVLFDDVQFTRRDWRNRNRIKTAQGVQWLTIPVAVKGNYSQCIRETQISDPAWGRKHWNSLVHSYSRAPHFSRYETMLRPLFSMDERSLSLVNHCFITTICDILGIETKITRSSDYQLTDGKSARLLTICQQAGADVYLSGPAARDYLDVELFRSNGIDVRFMDYSGYPEHHQLYPPFEHAVTVLDLIFNEGANAPRFMKSF
jgi:hypothetical protein